MDSGEAWDEFEHVRNELDALGGELHMLTDHAVSLDANFGKYGYSAHLRTYDDGEGKGSGSVSGRSSMADWEGHERKDWEAERRNGRIMKLYKKASFLLCVLSLFAANYTLELGVIEERKSDLRVGC